jgi:hypothetical protein
MRSFFRYPGGKYKLREVIIDRLLKQHHSPSFSQYREPFFGGGSISLVLLSRCPEMKRIWINDKDILPIRSIDFYYPEFQAANVRIFRDKSKICFLEPTWSNLCSNLLNLLDKVISSIPISPIISKGVLHVGGGLKCGNFGSQIGIEMY